MPLGHFTTLLSDLVLSLRQARVAFIVLLLGLVVSFAAWRVTGQWVYGDTARKFEQEVAQAVEVVDRRLQDNTNLLHGLRGLFAASERVDRDEFHRYVEGSNLAERYAGVRLVAYTRRVTRADKTAFEESVRRDRTLDPRGYPDFAIRPPGDRAEYLIVTYLEPMKGNERAFGFDSLSEAGRRLEFERVRDRGETTATGPLRLAADAHQKISLLLRAPIYRRDLPTATVEQRRTAFVGVVSAAIHVNELMEQLLGMQLGKEFELVVHDIGIADAMDKGGKIARESLLFDSRQMRDAASPPIDESKALKKVAAIDVAGRTWQLSFTSPHAEYGVARVLPPVILLAGTLTTLLLTWLVGTLSLSRARALRLAEQATAVRAAEGVREQLSFIQQLIETVPQPIFFKASDGRYLGVNKAWESFFGIPRQQFIGKTVFELYPNDQELARRHHARDQELFNRPGSQSYEAAIVAADGSVHHTIYNKATFNKADGGVAGLIGTITDVSELKTAEAALREGEARFRDLTELSSDWYWEQDAELRFTQLSSKIREFIPDADSLLGKTRWELGLSGVTEEQWRVHRKTLAEHQPFRDFQYERQNSNGEMRIISIAGRPIFDEEGRFKGYRGTGRDITDAKRVEERIRHMAHHDALTDLPNRLLLYDRIAQLVARSRRTGLTVAVLFIDLDRFKNVNDSLGHQVGDRLLQLVSERLLACIRESDTVARIGGDEFVVVVPDLAEPADAAGVAQKLLESLSQPVRIESHDLHITPSIGICAYPHDGEDVETLMRNADTAMYHAKEMGRNNYQFFTADMNTAAQHRLALENDLRRALERSEELTLHYQPQLDLTTGDIIGFEALARWRHPERGMVPPSQFIPVAEESGLINRLGEWVLQQACAQAAEWRAGGFPQLQVAVNLSAQQFRRKGIAGTVADVLRQTGLPANCLELEITESVIIQQAAEAVVKLTELSDMNVQLSLDDFGTGYSSLSYLKRFPIDKLKIDQSFVRDISTDPDDAAIVTAIIAMAHSLGLEVIAEGVETAEQLAFLKLLGCDKAQGYYFSKPLPAQEFANVLHGWSPQARVATA